MATVFILTCLLFIGFADWVFLPRQARRGYWAMIAVFSAVGLAALFPRILSAAAATLGIGRGVDLVIYLGMIVLVREYFLSRARQTHLERQLTLLVRQLSLEEAFKKYRNKLKTDQS